MKPALLLLGFMTCRLFAEGFASTRPEWTPLRSLAEKSRMQVGAAVKYPAFQSDPVYRAMLLREYNLLVPENELKWATLRPNANSFAFDKADEVVNFALTNSLAVRGHTLCWNLDKWMPRWVLDEARTPEQARLLLETHIRTVVKHYQGHVKCWDVVNEAVANRTNGLALADGYWKRMLGDEYVQLAFKWAHEADPEAQLFYNDYDKGDSLGLKSGRIYDLVKDLVERKVPIYGVGLQMHCSLGKPPVEADVRANIERLTKLGLKVQITEMDVDIDGVEGTLPERLERQGHIYGIVARAAMNNPDCTAFVTWGVTDRWGNPRRNKLNGKPDDGPTCRLPFDENYQPKPAAFSIAEAIQSSVAKCSLAQAAASYLVPAVDLKTFGRAEYSQANKTLHITGDDAGFQWQGVGMPPGSYQLWVTYYCGEREAHATLDWKGLKKAKPLLYMGLETIDRFYDSDDRPVSNLKGRGSQPEQYYFREYWGTFEIGDNADLKMTYRGGRDIRVQSIEFSRVNRHQEALSPLLNAAVGFYENATPDNALTRCVFNPATQKESASSSIAVCGVALAAFAISHDMDRAPEESRRRALNLLRALNGRIAGLHLNRHESGLFQHFVDCRTGKSSSEFSTIDTAILVSDALLARNVFHDPEITAEADALWNSIDWSRFVIQADPVMSKFDFTGGDMDKFKDQSDPDKIRGVGMFNEYILLAYYCQQYENLEHPPGSRRTIMPDLPRLPKQVFRNRILLGRQIQPSFIVQFPFFMSELCTDELYFSYVAAQGTADRNYNSERFMDRSAWGVSAGWSPKKPYVVLNFINNPDHVVSPPIMAGFIPVMPIAADDLFRLYQNPAQRQQLPFGEVLPQYVPGTALKSDRIPGVDYSVWLYGLAWNHPRLGSEWFGRNTRFTFNQKASRIDDDDKADGVSVGVHDYKDPTINQAPLEKAVRGGQTYTPPVQLEDGIPVATLKDDQGTKRTILKVIKEIESGKYQQIDSLLIAQNGRLLVEEYFNSGRLNEPHTTMSITKSVTACAMGKAIDLGLVQSEDDPVIKYLPYVDKSALQPGVADIRIKDVLSMRSGIVVTPGHDRDHYREKTPRAMAQKLLSNAQASTAGVTFRYKHFDPTLVALVITEVSGLTLEDFVKKYLFAPMQITDYQWAKDGPLHGCAAGLDLTSRDLLKLGLLIRNQGTFNGQRILSESWVKKMTSIQYDNPNPSKYGYFWWYESRVVDGKEYVEHSARGALGQFVSYYPALDLIAVFTSSNHKDAMTLPVDIMRQEVLPAFVRE